METVKGWKKSSLPSRYYKWFYAEYDLPTNLCPYFWKSMFMYIMTVPYLILSLPTLIIAAINRDDPDDTWQRLIIGIVIYAAIFLAWSFLFVPYFILVWGDVDAVGFWNVLMVVGLLVWIIGIIIGIFQLIKLILRYAARFGEKTVDTIQYSKPTNMITAFVKAKYHKYCPKIEWED